MEKSSRSRFLEVAIPLFAQKGFNAVSIRELSEKAAANSALISYYFGNKEGLYAAALELQFARIPGAFTIIDGLSPSNRILHYGKTVAALHRECPYLIRYLHNEIMKPTACFESIIQKHLASAYSFLHRALLEGIASGEFRQDLDPGYSAMAIAGIVNFYFIAKPLAQTFLPPIDHPDDTYVTQALDIYLNGVRNK